MADHLTEEQTAEFREVEILFRSQILFIVLSYTSLFLLFDITLIKLFLTT